MKDRPDGISVVGAAAGGSMLCEKCKRLEATVHLTEIIKNVKSEIHLCESCAREIGLNSRLSNFNLSVPDMLSFLDVDEAHDMLDGTVCKFCGNTFLDYKKSGKLGCPECYRHLQASLEPVIAGHHGERKHVGKMPLNYVEIKSPSRVFIDTSVKLMDKNETAADLRRRLDQAVRDERYEEAAAIRDRLKQQEQGGEGGKS